MIVTLVILSMAMQGAPAQRAVPRIATAPDRPIADSAVLRERDTMLDRARATLARADAMLAAMPPANPNRNALEAARRRLAARTKGLEQGSKLGSFEVRHLIQVANQAETLTSSLLKKEDDRKASVINNVG